MEKLWFEEYEQRRNQDGSVDILMPSAKGKEQRTIRLFEYQLKFLRERYGAGSFSETLRKAVDDLIKRKESIRQIMLTQQEIR